MDPEKANRTIGGYVAVALVLFLVAGVTMSAAADADATGGDGSITLLIGWLIASVAGFFALVGAVGFGVKYGVAAARHVPTDTED